MPELKKITEKKWTRNCPKCNKELTYCDKYVYQKYEKLKSLCIQCTKTGKGFSDKHKRNLSISHKGHVKKEESKKKLSNSLKKYWSNPIVLEDRSGEGSSMYGKHHSEETKKKIRISNSKWIHSPVSLETKEKISKSLTGRPSQNKGKRHSDETKKKLRMAFIGREGIKIVPNYNPTACLLIEEYGKQYGYNFQHALNGGEYHIEELGYWVDGYDKEKNVVIEYYEKHHRRTMERDERRKNEIIQHLECIFIELKEE